MQIWAIVPVKPLHRGKSRLAHLLSPQERAELIGRFLARTLTMLQRVPTVAQVVVVSSDERVLNLARRQGAYTLAEKRPFGLNVAVTNAAAFAVGRGAEGVLVLPADLPFAREQDVAMMVGTAVVPTGPYNDAFWQEERGIMTICSDEKRQGTNALLLTPPLPFTFQYGSGSFQRHLQEAQRRGLSHHIVAAQSLQFDLDTEEDWRTYKQHLNAGQATGIRQ